MVLAHYKPTFLAPRACAAGMSVIAFSKTTVTTTTSKTKGG